MLFVVVEGYDVFGAEVWVYRAISCLRMWGFIDKIRPLLYETHYTVSLRLIAQGVFVTSKVAFYGGTEAVECGA